MPVYRSRRRRRAGRGVVTTSQQESLQATRLPPPKSTLTYIYWGAVLSCPSSVGQWARAHPSLPSFLRYTALRRTTWPSSSTRKSGWCAAKTAGCERARLLKALRPYSRSMALAGRRQCLVRVRVRVWPVAASACPTMVSWEAPSSRRPRRRPRRL
eukprot:scaffold19947_cov58-Phaeocystis_antarctica.AAC.1